MLNAVEAAQAQGMRVITLTGKDGGKLANKADIKIRVPPLVTPTAFKKFTSKSSIL
ncbi:MAG: hypothetical protein WBA23_18770 [Tunicatimonas sp.]|uniref:hypothetical protein n=1 Tax=Tunicatimonas sp. TaxID=1940096 RepID=UPI003C778331